jgi:Icc-related predicted phosphoesterase
MRMLLFSDLHRDAEAARRLVDMSRDVDVVVGAGDFATMRHGLQDVIEPLSEIDQPAVLVAGNAESHEELADACRAWPRAHVLHGSGCQILGIPFWGIGGAIPVTPFGAWSYDLSEEAARPLLASCPPQAVLVSHSPPQGAVDSSSRGQRLGSVALRETIERCEPRLVVCGHIHDCAGQSAKLGPTDIINAGPQGIIWQLTN